MRLPLVWLGFKDLEFPSPQLEQEELVVLWFLQTFWPDQV